MMNKIEQMIEGLCPDGVEYRKLGEVFQRIKGTPITAAKMKEIAVNDGEIRIFAGGKTIIDAHEEDIPNANITRVPAVLIQSRGVIDAVFVDRPFTFKNEMWAYTADNVTSLKFLHYYLRNNIDYFKGLAGRAGSLPQISLPVTENYEIPLPPLPIQEEIVRILDKFTQLEAELEAELDCRKRQYEYYRDKLLAFEGRDDVEWKKLGEVGTFVRGNGLQKKDFTERGVGCIHYGQIYTHYGTWAAETKSFVSEQLASKLKKAKKGDIVIATTSENVEDVCKACAWLGEEDIAISGDAYIYKHQLNPKYVAYFFQTDQFFQYKRKSSSGTKVIRVSGDSMEKFLIPIPPLSEQQRIADILDCFEALTSDISQGLPAEIKARRQQYEYYRDKLLTFNRKQA